MKKYIFILLIIVSQLFSCTNINKTETKSTTEDTLRINETELPQSCFPYDVNNVVDFHVLSQNYNGLVKYDAKNMEINPDNAKKWESNNEGKKYI